jgi:hypothetical protein
MPPPEVPKAAAAAAADVLGALLGTLDPDQLEVALALAPVALKGAELLQQIQKERAALAKERIEIAHARTALARERAALARERGDPQASPRLDVLTIDEEGRLVSPRRITYAWCCAFVAAPSEVYKHLSHQRRSHYKRVARLPIEIGRALDRAGFSFSAIRFVAYGTTPQEQQTRLEHLLAGGHPPRASRAKSEARQGKRRARGRPLGSKTKPRSPSP